MNEVEIKRLIQELERIRGEAQDNAMDLDQRIDLLEADIKNNLIRFHVEPEQS